MVEYNLSFLLEFLYNKFMKSIPSKILMSLGIISTILSLIFRDNFTVIYSQLIVYLFFSSIVNCMLYGGCTIGAWLLIIVPLLGCIIIILDKIGYFKETKQKLKKLLDFLKKHEILVPNPN